MEKICKVWYFRIILIALFVLFLASAFIAKEGEYKVIRQFDAVVKIKAEPGLGFKIPFIQTVSTLPKYQMKYDVSQAEINQEIKRE